MKMDTRHVFKRYIGKSKISDGTDDDRARTAPANLDSKDIAPDATISGGA